MSLYTKTGDSGQTDLLTGGRVGKHHPAVQVLAALDEASAAIGLVKAMATAAEKDIYTRAQRNVMRVMALVAGQPCDSAMLFCEEPLTWNAA